MKRATLIVLALAMLVALALLFHREPRAEQAFRASRPAAVALPSRGPAAIALPPDAAIPPPPRSPEPKAPPAVKEGGGSIRGLVKISGVAPRRRTTRTDSDPKCKETHPDGILRDDIVVDLGNNVQWAFVYVAKGVKETPVGPLLPVLLDQVGCRFEPHVLGVQVHQPINIYNNDRFLHTVHAVPIDNKEFNFGLRGAAEFETKVFTRPEVMIPIKCDIHPWMRAWVGVMDHPYFSVTTETGNYGIPNLPPGRYLVRVWHELYATVEHEVEVTPGVDVRQDFWLDARRD